MCGFVWRWLVWKNCKGRGSAEASQGDLQRCSSVSNLSLTLMEKAIFPTRKKNDTKHGICSFGLAKRLTSVLSQQTRWPFWPSRSSIRCTCDKFEHLKTLLYKFVSTFVRPLEATLHYIHSFILISVIKPISIIVDWFSTCQQWYILKPTRWRNGTVIIYKPDLCQHFSSVTNVLLIFVLNRILYCGRLSAWSAIKFLTLCCLTGYYYTII